MKYLFLFLSLAATAFAGPYNKVQIVSGTNGATGYEKVIIVDEGGNNVQIMDGTNLTSGTFTLTTTGTTALTGSNGFLFVNGVQLFTGTGSVIGTSAGQAAGAVNGTMTSGTQVNPTSTGTDSGAETMANKILTAPVINSGTLTGPTAQNPTITGTVTQGCAILSHKDGTSTVYTPTANTDAARWTSLASAIGAMTGGEKLKVVGAGDFLASSQVTLTGTTEIDLGQARIYISGTTEFYLFTSTGAHELTIRGGIFDGAGIANAYGAMALGSMYRCRLVDITFKNWGVNATALFPNGNATTEGSAKAPQGEAIGLNFVSCNEALINTAEYWTFTNCTWKLGAKAIQNWAGNVTFMGCTIAATTSAGFQLIHGTNDGHGQWIGGHINHNTGSSIVINSDLVNGFNFIGAHIYSNDSTSGWIDVGSKGINFLGGNIDAPIKCSGSTTGLNSFRDILFPGTYCDISSLSSTDRENIKFTNGTTLSGLWLNNDFAALSGTSAPPAASPGSFYSQIVSGTATTWVKKTGTDANGWVGIAATGTNTDINKLSSIATGSLASPALKTGSSGFNPIGATGYGEVIANGVLQGVYDGFGDFSLVVSGANSFVPSNGGFVWLSRGIMNAPANGQIQLLNGNATSFDRLILGPATSSFPMLKRSATTVQFRTANDGADAPISASTISISGTSLTTPNSLAISGTTLVFIDSGTNAHTITVSP